VGDLDKIKVMKADVLIIGSGISGLFTALNLPQKLKILIVTKRDIFDSSTKFAQGGISCVASAYDTFENHIQDTLRTGCGLSAERIVEIVVREAPERIKDLMDYGEEDLTFILKVGILREELFMQKITQER